MPDRLQKQASDKAGQQNFGNGVVIISLLMELLIGNEKRSLPLCTYVVGFDKSGHNSTIERLLGSVVNEKSLDKIY